MYGEKTYDILHYSVHTIATSIVKEHGVVDADTARSYVKSYVASVHCTYSTDVVGFDELVADVTMLVAGARIEQVVILPGDDTAEVQMDTCPYDCSRCHEHDDCPCRNCRRYSEDEDDE